VTPTGSAGGHREVELGTQLHQWAQKDGGGLAFGSSAGFLMPDGALLSPDASWVRRERWDALSPEERESFAPLCPDAVFEIRSADQAVAILRKKMQSYLANGAHIAVLIDPHQRAVEVYRPGREPETHVNPAGVALDPDLPGFVLYPRSLFTV
jgi:Uma2 family endonuclease